MPAGISLANKSQLLFGFSVVVLLGAALLVPWIWTRSLIDESQHEIMRQLYEAWLSDQIKLGGAIELGRIPPPYDVASDTQPVRMSYVRLEELEFATDTNPFFTRVIEYFNENPGANEFLEVEQVDGPDVYHYAHAIRESALRRIQDRRLVELPPDAIDPMMADRLRGVLLIDRRSEFASSQLLVGSMYIVAAWLLCSLLAILVFYLILKRLILSPVRKLRETAEKIEAGDTSIRATIRTGDEFEQLSNAFNSMLERFGESQRQLRNMNETLDLRLSELAEANFALYESNRLKGEFLASVSHELKTPLNLIIGFGELLEEIARNDAQPDPKRLRYIDNILTSARSLLEMINDLLEMAKIEAGRIELSIEPTNLNDLVEGLVKLMQSEAERRGVALRTELAPNLPAIETDAGKLQQILYNFLSNALKFTPRDGTVTIFAECVTERGRTKSVRLGVADTGIGVPQDMLDVIFEKFRQVDASHTREHQGVGLGLAICKELATMLGGQLSVESEPGEGATFSIEMPLAYEVSKPKPLMAGTPAEPELWTDFSADSSGHAPSSDLPAPAADAPRRVSTKTIHDQDAD